MGRTTSRVSAGCSQSREQILGSVSAARRAALERGFAWLDADVPYSQSAQHEGYRTDCSGFVSMVWELPMPGATTSTLPSSSIALDSMEELVPGDALDDPGHHAVIFLGFEDDGGICVIEQSSTANDMQFRVRSAGSLSGYQPIRAEQFANDTSRSANTGNAGNTGGLDCTQAQDPAAVCMAASLSSGVQCGPVADGCGGKIDCSAVPGFGCGTTGTCQLGKCVAGQPQCTPKTAAAACASARELSGAECGAVSDGCGGKVDCDEVEGFGCSRGSVCGAKNKCSESTLENADAPVTPSGDEGDDGDDDAKKPSFVSKNKAVKQSAGCSASPSGATGDGLFAFAGLGAVLALARRRRGRRES